MKITSAPVFRFEPSELTLQPSVEAFFRQQGPSPAWKLKTPDRVREEARARVSQMGGEPTNPQEVLAESELQFGQYRGLTFRWLLGNDVGYACGVIASHERESGDTTQTPLMEHKDALTSYARLFPPMVAAIARRKMSEGSKSVRGLDSTVVGFGAHAHVSFKSLYEAKETESRT